MTLEESKVSWIALFAFIVPIALMTCIGWIAFIRTLKRDIRRYTTYEDDDDDWIDCADEVGWKLLWSDVFRQPAYSCIMMLIIANGTHLLCFIGISIVLYLTDLPFSWINTQLIYAFTSYANGYHTIRMAHILDIDTSTKSPYALYSIILPASILIWFNNDVSMLPIIIATLMIMTLIGTQGKYHYYSPCRVNRIPRMIPNQPWYTNKYLNIGIVGIIIFMICKIILRNIELLKVGDLISEEQELYTSRHFYLLLLITLLVLLLILPLLTTAMTYMQLNNEDWQWRWRSIFISGSVAIYPLIYAIQSFRFEINSVANDIILVMGTFLVTASIGFNAANYWVHQMYTPIVCD